MQRPAPLLSKGFLLSECRHELAAGYDGHGQAEEVVGKNPEAGEGITEVTWMLREGCLLRPGLHVEALALQGCVHYQL